MNQYEGGFDDVHSKLPPTFIDASDNYLFSNNEDGSYVPPFPPLFSFYHEGKCQLNDKYINMEKISLGEM